MTKYTRPRGEGLLDWNDDTWWGGGARGGGERVLGEERDAMLPWQNFWGQHTVFPLPGCHHKPIKKAAHPSLICLNFLRNIFYFTFPADTALTTGIIFSSPFFN